MKPVNNYFTSCFISQALKLLQESSIYCYLLFPSASKVCLQGKRFKLFRFKILMAILLHTETLIHPVIKKTACKVFLTTFIITFTIR